MISTASHVLKYSMLAGDVLLSAAILFSGALQSIIFCVLRGCIDRSTFFRQQIVFFAFCHCVCMEGTSKELVSGLT